MTALDSKLTATLDLDLTSADASPTTADLQTYAILNAKNATAARVVTLPTFTGTIKIITDPGNTHTVEIVRGTTNFNMAAGSSTEVKLDGTSNYMVEIGGGGSSGGGLPSGGSTGQVLTKLSATDGDADWVSIGGLPPTVYRLTINSIASGTTPTIAEVAFSKSGSVQDPVSAVASSNYDPVTQPLTNLWDHDTTTWWGGGTPPMHVDFTFAAGEDFDKVTLTPRDSGNYPQAPSNFDILVSYDAGTTFIATQSFTHTWASGTAVDFTITSIPSPPLPSILPPGGSTGQVLTKIDGTDYNVEWSTPSGGGGGGGPGISHKDWMFVPTAIGGSAIAISELKFNLTAGGTRATPSTTSDSGHFGSLDSTLTQDNDTSTIYASSGGGFNWIKAHFTSAVTYEEIVVIGRQDSNFGQNVAYMDVFVCDDAASWVFLTRLVDPAVINSGAWTSTWDMTPYA